jgi:hypothetical protein
MTGILAAKTASLQPEFGWPFEHGRAGEIKEQRRNGRIKLPRMRSRMFVLVAICAGLTASTGAQEGHPLTGTWAGDWGPSGTQRTHITMVMNWDGKSVTGLINPGPDAVPLTAVLVDWDRWSVRIEAKGIAAEGRLEDIGSYHRRIVGTWNQGGAKGDFRLTRE